MARPGRRWPSVASRNVPVRSLTACVASTMQRFICRSARLLRSNASRDSWVTRFGVRTGDGQAFPRRRDAPREAGAQDPLRNGDRCSVAVGGNREGPGAARGVGVGPAPRRRATWGRCGHGGDERPRRSATHLIPYRDYSMISSICESNTGEIVNPSACAVFRFITAWSLVGCSTGRSAGLAPLMILST